MGVVELVFGVFFGLAAMLGLTAAAVSAPSFDWQSAFKVEVPGVGVPKQDVADDVREILNDWEAATKGVEKVSFTAQRFAYDSTFKVVKLSRVSFDSSDSIHGRMLFERVSVDSKNSTMMVKGESYIIQSEQPEEWSSDGVELRHVDLSRKESEILPIRNAQGEENKIVSMIIDYGTFYRQLFADFSTEKFVGRFNVVAGSMHKPHAESKTYHLICEPHDEGAKGEYLRYVEKFEIIIDGNSYRPTAIKFEAPASDRRVVLKFIPQE